MTTVLKTIYDLTVEIEALVTHPGDIDRNAYIDKLQELLKQRGPLTQQLVPGACSEEERPMVEEIMAMNRRINEALDAMKLAILNDMGKFRHRKRTVNRYRHPYTGPTKDGMFLDKRE